MGHRLEDSPFFKLRNRRRLEKVLLISHAALIRVLSRAENYTPRWKHKEDDSKWLTSPPPAEDAAKYRLIEIPKPDLKAIQSRIADLLSRISAPDYLFSPVKGRSYVDNARRHIGASEFHLLDIADYFPSCSANKVAWLFRSRMQCSPDVAAILVKLVTHEERLPQGSPCSPILSFMSNSDMWETVNSVVAGRGCCLSVYADDITVSGAYIPGELIWQVKKVIFLHGFRLKAQKETRLKGRPADITGVIVRDSKVYLPNRQLKKLVELRRKWRHANNADLRRDLHAQIAGRLAQRRQVEGR